MKRDKKLKVFVDCHVFDEGFQGTRTYIEGVYKELIKDTTRQFYLAAGNIDNLASIFGQHSNVVYIKYRIHNKIFRLLGYLPWLIVKHGIDVAHFQYRVPPLKFCKYMVTTHDVLFEDFPEYFPKIGRKVSYYTYKISAKLADVVFTVSPYSRKAIVQHLGIKEARVTPNGIDTIFFEKYDKVVMVQLAAEKFKINNYLLYISRWEPRKNQHMILKAFNELKLYESYNLVFAGETTFKNPEYDAYYAALPHTVKQKVVRLGRINFADMLMVLRGARLFVYPSIAEGFGIPPLEALAAGVPTISSNATAMEDYIHFMGQWQFDPQNYTEFKDVLLKALNNPEQMDISGIKNEIKTRYSWNIAARVISGYLNTV
ncbi:glycosyltransferase family 4 protein [Flavobacterium sp. RHBU_24]|uniref:glycosyltransferase family 4 protein n=1 Tax=Flavobacterium sp. RHBU_24 TaxID=3391185 RepID=UPI00398543C6